MSSSFIVVFGIFFIYLIYFFLTCVFNFSLGIKFIFVSVNFLSWGVIVIGLKWVYDSTLINQEGYVGLSYYNLVAHIVSSIFWILGWSLNAQM